MKMLIGKNKVDASDGATIEVYNPATSELIDTVPKATPADIEMALDCAAEGKKKWCAISMRERADILLRAAEMIWEDREAIATILAKETGKVFPQALGEVRSAHRLLRGYAQKGAYTYETMLPHDTDLIVVKHEPLGVVACVIPFNFPIELYAHKVAPALTAGNAVIVKPASDTPLSALYITEIIHKAGVPEEALQVVTGSGAVVGSYLASSPKVNAISLTGSTEVGIDIAKNAAKHLARNFCELGGNDALIILDDADIDAAVRGAVNCRTYNAGQVCSTSKRFIVSNQVKEEFTEKLIQRLKTLRIGDPFAPETEVGSLISVKAGKEIEQQIQHTVDQGAKCIYGGKLMEYAFFEPAVLVDVTPDMDIAQDMEVFGPVFPIIGFDTEEEAIRIANNTKYGLAGGIITKDVQRGARLAEKVDTGMIVVNPSSCYRTIDIPFGGHKMSGIGNEGISATLHEMMQIKTTVITQMH